MLNQIFKGIGQDTRLIVGLLAVGGGLAWFLTWKAKDQIGKAVDGIVPEQVQEAIEDIPDGVKDAAVDYGANMAKYGPFVGPAVTGYQLADQYRDRFWDWLLGEDEKEGQTPPGADYQAAWADSAD